MSDKTNQVTTSNTQGVAQRQESSEQPRRTVTPAVDVFEDASGITLLADMPGVARDRVDIRLDGDALVVEGQVGALGPEGLEPVWAEVSVPHYRRSFTLSRELDTAKIEATMKDGVLSLRIPKQEHAQPRRIAVTAA
jgi:HSP20 family molecular chaperone IbpA